MTGDELSRRLMATFVEELEEHAREVERTLGDLATAPEAAKQEHYRTLFRLMHGLKGAARAVSVREIEALCHALEDRLSDAREGRGAPRESTLALLGRAHEALTRAAGRLRRNQPVSADGELAELTALVSGAPSEPSRSAPVPASSSTASAPLPASVSVPLPPPSAPSRPRAAPAAESAVSGAKPTLVRMAADELDALLVHSGELLVAKDRVEGRADSLIGLRELVSAWRADVRLLGKDARRGAAHERKKQTSAKRAEDVALRLEKELERVTGQLTSDVRNLGLVARRLDDEVRRARLLPFREACDGLERTVAELARSAGKRARLVVNGGDLGVDRVIVQKLREPLLHLVRNALDHGLETELERGRLAKSREGTLTVSAVVEGTRIAVSVDDDGSGIDRERIRAVARARGIPEPSDARELLRLIFLPGFTTAPSVTSLSGRGVGLDAVVAAVEALHGTVDVESARGAGTCFRLAVPMTLSTLRVVLLSVSGSALAVPAESVERVFRIRATDIVTAEGSAMLRTDGAPIPLVALGPLLGLPPSPPRELAPAVVMSLGASRIAFRVDDVTAECEVLVKSLGARLVGLPLAMGAAILASGRVVLILNSSDLVRRAEGARPDDFASLRAETEGVTRKKLLVVDDTLTTRTLLKSILETAGYEVTTAMDGEEAYRLLDGRDFAAVVTDVEMPKMDGFELTRRVRATPRFVDLPVVLVTGLASDVHRKRGLEAGANAYLEKSVFDQKVLLDTIRELA